MRRMVSSRFVVAVSALSTVLGCASNDARTALEARVGALEQKVAELEAAPAASASAAVARCDKYLDATVPPDTKFTHTVPFEIGEDTVVVGDRIQITEVLGTRDRFEQGGMYLVRGEYTLSSADEASLGFSVTATRKGEGCTRGNGRRGSQRIKRGVGTFELAAPVLYDGHPHVYFRDQGQSAGGVYFGSGEFLKK